MPSFNVIKFYDATWFGIRIKQLVLVKKKKKKLIRKHDVRRKVGKGSSKKVTNGTHATWTTDGCEVSVSVVTLPTKALGATFRKCLV